MFSFQEVEKLSTRLNQLEERAEELDRSILTSDWSNDQLNFLDSQYLTLVRKRSQKISSIALINDKNRRKNIERAEEGIRPPVSDN